MPARLIGVMMGFNHDRDIRAVSHIPDNYWEKKQWTRFILFFLFAAVHTNLKILLVALFALYYLAWVLPLEVACWSIIRLCELSGRFFWVTRGQSSKGPEELCSTWEMCNIRWEEFVRWALFTLFDDEDEEEMPLMVGGLMPSRGRMARRVRRRGAFCEVERREWMARRGLSLEKEPFEAVMPLSSPKLMVAERDSGYAQINSAA